MRCSHFRIRQRQGLGGGLQGLTVSSSPFSVESVFCEGGSVTPPVAEGEGVAVRHSPPPQDWVHVDGAGWSWIPSETRAALQPSQNDQVSTLSGEKRRSECDTHTLLYNIATTFVTFMFFPFSIASC